MASTFGYFFGGVAGIGLAGLLVYGVACAIFGG